MIERRNVNDEELRTKLKEIFLRRASKRKGTIPKGSPECERAGYEAISVGSKLTQDEVEFGRAMERQRRVLHRPLDCRDVLDVARSLGYRKT